MTAPRNTGAPTRSTKGNALNRSAPHPLPSTRGRDDRCRIYLVRHGRTLLNAEIRFRGRLEVPLDDVGRREAWEAARSLAGAGLSAVYTSSLGRAREVARAICSTAGVDGSDDLSGLINLDYGKWHGLTKQEAAERHPEEWWLYRQAPELATCPGGEPLARAADRVTHELLEIARRHPGEAVAAVTHGVMVRLAALRSHGRFGGDVELGDWQIPLPTGSATIFEVSGGKLSLVHVPEVVHGAAIPTGHALGRRPAVTRAAVS